MKMLQYNVFSRKIHGFLGGKAKHQEFALENLCNPCCWRTFNDFLMGKSRILDGNYLSLRGDGPAMDQQKYSPNDRSSRKLVRQSRNHIVLASFATDQISTSETIMYVFLQTITEKTGGGGEPGKHDGI